jgi:hypothetical protein
MGLFKKSGSFGSSIGSAISKVFGGGNAAKTHAVAKKYGGQPPTEALKTAVTYHSLPNELEKVGSTSSYS